MTGVKKVISGGQRGADIAALRAAKELGLETGGWLPKGFKTADGLKPGYAKKFGCQEHLSDRYPPRTFQNVLESDATMRFATNFNSAGERCTMKAIRQYQKPFLDIPLGYEETGRIVSAVSPAEAGLWLLANNVLTLNVAGNANQGIEDFVSSFVRAMLTGRTI